MASNLPPGVTESMIPGNRPEDVAWEKLLDEIAESPLTAEEARRRWKIGNKIADSHDRILSLCSDHRGKQHGKQCLACTIEHLLKAAKFARAVIEHRFQQGVSVDHALPDLRSAILEAEVRG